MAGFGPALPFRRSAEDGIALTHSMLEVIRQNLKNVVLTIPGERVMVPDFGVGIKRYLFQMSNNTTKSEITGKIREQVSKYMPHIAIRSIKYKSTAAMIDAGELAIKIVYTITPLSITDVLELQV